MTFFVYAFLDQDIAKIFLRLDFFFFKVVSTGSRSVLSLHNLTVDWAINTV